MSVKSFYSNIDNLYEMLEFISSQAELTGFSTLDISHIEIAAEEALVNIISYAYPEHVGNIEIACLTEKGEKLTIKIIDHGIPFNPLSKPKKVDLSKSVEELRPGGYGIYFITRMMDTVEYTRENDSNVLILIKHVIKKDSIKPLSKS